MIPTGLASHDRAPRRALRAASSLTWPQYRGLLKPIHPDRVSKDPRGNDHLEAWDVRRNLIRHFGFGGWSFDVEATLVKEIQLPPRRRQDQQGQEYGEPYTPWSVIYRAIGRLSIHPFGVELCHYEDGATGDATNQPSLGDAHDMALKTCLSQTLKRCAVNLGDQFGLSLYGDTLAATVLATYVPPFGPESSPPAPPDEAKAEPGGAS